ncbi:MAG: class I tRNA ligase family protein, partial [Candidatus Neomarinimicrobiota bacterium]|nr:class I tRNA ligase family protein [Candidatus Neomarinimicrobiota bacterium]
TNHIQKLDSINIDTIRSFIIIMNPFMPHLAQELWELIGETNELTYQAWPDYDKDLAISDEIVIPIQINGKRRSEILISANESESEVISKAKSDDKIASYLKNTTIIKEIYIKGKILNIVIKQ